MIEDRGAKARSSRPVSGEGQGALPYYTRAITDQDKNRNYLSKDRGEDQKSKRGQHWFSALVLLTGTLVNNTVFVVIVRPEAVTKQK